MTGTLKLSNAPLGKVVEPCSCCDPIYEITNFLGELKYIVTAECCQCGIICNNSCGKCSEVLFTIHKPGKQEMTPQNADGFIKKKFSGLQELLTDADNFELVFPTSANAEEKLLLIGAVIMIDFRYYEDNGGNQRHGHVVT
jgi:hypothetical protein